jgi:hypothetical protein
MACNIRAARVVAAWKKPCQSRLRAFHGHDVFPTTYHQRKLCELCPREFHDVVHSLDGGVMEELDYIRVLYRPPAMDGEQRITVRATISNIVRSKTSGWSDHELEFFIWLLRYFRAF